MSEVSKSRLFFALALSAILSLVVSVLALSPLAPAAPVKAAADVMTNAGSQSTTLDCCGRGMFGSGNGSRLYPYSYGGRMNEIKTADNAIKRIDNPSGETAVAQSSDRSTAYIMSDGGFYSLNTNTGVRNF